MLVLNYAIPPVHSENIGQAFGLAPFWILSLPPPLHAFARGRPDSRTYFELHRTQQAQLGHMSTRTHSRLGPILRPAGPAMVRPNTSPTCTGAVRGVADWASSATVL